ncbi:hypothetical protein NZ039_22380, partial [Escherichia coli]|nr:hypothetical protein [Escherichia coli]
MGTKSDGQVEVDDNGYVMGSSEKGAYFRVHASKSETDHNLGLGFAPIFPDICYHLTHYKPAAADIPVASDNPAHYADA